MRVLSDLIDQKDVQDFRMYLYELCHRENKYLLKNDILLAFEDFCHRTDKPGLLEDKSSIYKLLKRTPELIITEDVAILMHRYQMARYRIYKISIHSDDIEEISIRELLDFRDRYVMPNISESEEKLRVNFMPFYDYGPSIKNVKSIGKGVEFLNKHMSSNLFQNPGQWNTWLFEFLKIHSFGNQQLLINGRAARDYQQFVEDLEETAAELESYDADTSHSEIIDLLKKQGFEPGWGDSVGRTRETMHLLLELFQSPDMQNLEKFVSRIPMISNIAIFSPHGWFGQENVLGRPDTGGQIVYILDQVRALERTLRDRIKSYGLSTQPKIIVITRLIPENEGTTSNVDLEKIHHTENSFILRVPFTDENGNVVSNWISRFKLWPYLERFAHDAKRAMLSEFQGKPDLIIGNYSDGNLVATLLADQLDVIQCNIAHALEKNKYLFSDLYWFNFENDYHFTLQFVADLISMNMADFIITSTFQEIAGSQDSGGQYESYLFYTMPGHMQVESGINLFHPKFNVIPPGVEETVYFPYTEKKRRLPNQTERLEQLLFNDQTDAIYGNLENPDKPPVFTMARLDHNKNITGLVESFGKSEELQQMANLIVIAGKINAEEAKDAEEVEEIRHMHGLIQEYQLDGKIRWLGMHLPKEDGGEVYRIIADHGGVFVQPGRFEGFGLTVLEAMHSGVPTFATYFGGPSEIIIHGESGFLINPTVPELISDPLLNFFHRLEKDPSYWKKISDTGIKRVVENFTWKLYSEKLLTLTALYGFWRYSESSVGKRELALYCHLLFQLLYKPRAKEIKSI